MSSMAKQALWNAKAPAKLAARLVGLAALPVLPGTPPMEAKLVGKALPAEFGLAVRAEMGRLPLPRLPRRRATSSCAPSPASRSAVFPRGGRAGPRACPPSASSSTASWSSRSAARSPSTRCRCGCIRPRAASASSPRDAGDAHPVRLPGDRTATALLELPLDERRAALETFIAAIRRRAGACGSRRSPAIASEAERWLARPVARWTASSPSASTAPTCRASARC